MTSDPTEMARRTAIRLRRAAGPATREQLAEIYGADDVYDTEELKQLFEVETFLAPFVVARRLADGARGVMEFQHHPRYYFHFVFDGGRGHASSAGV